MEDVNTIVIGIDFAIQDLLEKHVLLTRKAYQLF